MGAYMMHDRSNTSDLDTFFKEIPEDWYQLTDGDVEAPTGWFGLLIVDHELRETFGAPSSMAYSGFHLVTIDSNGIVHAFQAFTEWATRENFRFLQEEYTEWAKDGE